MGSLACCTLLLTMRTSSPVLGLVLTLLILSLATQHQPHSNTQDERAGKAFSLFSICGTNTGYHMYTEFGATSTDSITMTLTYGSSGLTTAKTFNILARQISCTASYKAPTDCTQYFTGVAGNVQSYSYGQLLKSQYYTNCIRTEAGYC